MLSANKVVSSKTRITIKKKNKKTLHTAWTKEKKKISVLIILFSYVNYFQLKLFNEIR